MWFNFIWNILFAVNKSSYSRRTVIIFSFYQFSIHYIRYTFLFNISYDEYLCTRYILRHCKFEEFQKFRFPLRYRVGQKGVNKTILFFCLSINWHVEICDEKFRAFKIVLLIRFLIWISQHSSLFNAKCNIKLYTSVRFMCYNEVYSFFYRSRRVLRGSKIYSFQVLIGRNT